jgi:hypothetical protein
LFEIYKKEDFRQSLRDYKNRFQTAIQSEDEREAAYHAYTLGFIPEAKDSLFEIIEQERERRNTKLIDEWTQEYRKIQKHERTEEKGLLILAGIISLLCRDLDYSHGEYRNQVSDWLSRPIEKATVPDRAYDMHTYEGKKRGRGLEHFFKEGASVKNERFANDWEEVGKEAYFQAQREGLPEAADLIKAIKDRVKKESVTDLFEL